MQSVSNNSKTIKLLPVLYSKVFAITSSFIWVSMLIHMQASSFISVLEAKAEASIKFTSGQSSQLLSVSTQEVPRESPLCVNTPGVREAVAGAVDHGAYGVVWPAETLLAQCLLCHLEIVFSHLPLVLLLWPDQVKFLLDDHFVMIPYKKMNFGVFVLDLRLDDNDDADCGWWRKLYFPP